MLFLYLQLDFALENMQYGCLRLYGLPKLLFTLSVCLFVCLFVCWFVRDCISEVSWPIWMKFCVLMGNGPREVQIENDSKTSNDLDTGQGQSF